MARKPNVFALLKNVEAFVKSVPIDPKAPNYAQWRREQVVMTRACRDVFRVWDQLTVVKAPVLALPCAGRVPLRTIMDVRLPCGGRVPLKQPPAPYIGICKLIPTKQVLGETTSVYRKR